jgi:hypothetical protein
MGMFDYILCKYPLPLKSAQNLEFQTKDTPCQFMDYYEITESGRLKRETYDIEDRSDKTAKGLAALAGCMTRVNKRWVRETYTGEIRFYTSLGKNHTGWIEFSAYFVKGMLDQIHLVTHRRPKGRVRAARPKAAVRISRAKAKKTIRKRA